VSDLLFGLTATDSANIVAAVVLTIARVAVAACRDARAPRHAHRPLTAIRAE
jgi:hypothetical protein